MGKNKKPTKPNPNEHLLLGIKRDEEEIKKYGKLLKIKKRKNKSKLSEIFMELDPVSGEEGDEGDEGAAAEDDSDRQEDEEELSGNNDGSDTMDTVTPSEPRADEGAECAQIRRLVRCQLNKLCESQMVRCLDDIESLWNEFPRGEVRDLLVTESLNYLSLSCLELAAFVTCLHVRFADTTSLVPFFLERLVQDLRMPGDDDTTPDDSTALRYRFVAYLTRLEILDCQLVLDLMEELTTSGPCGMARLKLLVDMSSIIGFQARKQCLQRCDALVARLRDCTATALAVASDLSELRSLRDATIDKLTSSRAKNDVAYDTVVKYRTAMRSWCKKSPQSLCVALRLADLRGDQRARWWLVGSAVDRSATVVLGNRSGAVATNSMTATQALSAQEERWRATARDLGLETEPRQRLFCVLMRGKEMAAMATDSEDDAAASDTVVAIRRLQLEKGPGGERLVLPEPDVAAVIMRCVALETSFCQFYVEVLAGLLETQRRFRQAIKCAIWDLLAQPRLVDSARHNCGRCLGQLITSAEFPVNCLRKYNFMDDSLGNVTLMRAVLTEVLDSSWDDIEDILREMRKSISVKFVSNLRLFLKKNMRKSDSTVAGGGGLGKAIEVKITKCITFLHELRKAAADQDV